MTQETMDKELLRTVSRIETKLVRFAEELGVDIDVDPDWITVNRVNSTILLTTLGRSLLVIKAEALKRGAVAGSPYMVWFEGKAVGMLYL